ncbi:MAG: M10 family metallopeptidase, partial [Hyphomonadaceae bacterium]|nr:M10 family metallopeptidase [Hyphomonadaceae bacterium]
MPRMNALAPAPGGEQAFQTPSSGIAPNGLPYFDWDQGAQQLNREGWSWSATLGTPVTITYAFRQTGTPPSDAGVSGFQQFNAIQIATAEQLLARWAEVANISFVRVGAGYSNEATILFGNFLNGPAQFSAFAFLPTPEGRESDLENGDIWVNGSRNYDADPVSFPLGAQILLHEIGHTLGLLHPSVYDGGAQSGVTYDADADFWQDTRQFTVQSYFNESFTGGSYGQYYVTTPQMFDIAAAQYLYGPNMTTRTGATTYGFNSNTGIGAFSIASAAQGAIFCIWDAGGIDTLDLSGYGTNSEIDLRPESFSSAGTHSSGAMRGNISIARGVTIENAIGGSGNDTIIGNGANNILIGGAGADRISGGDGNDLIYADAADELNFVTGGAGTDTFAFTSGSAPTTFNLVAQGFEAAEGRFTDTGSNPWATR